MIALEVLAKVRSARPQLLPQSLAHDPYSFRPKVSFCLDMGNCVVKTIDTPRELLEAMRLRHEVFYEETGRAHPSGLDCDEFDLLADHVIVLYRSESRIIGTYRLLASPFTDRFYSQHEFQLGAFLKSPGTKLELGRACVAREHRNGIFINLIWKGLAKYAALIKADQLFGCSTVWNEDPRVAWGLFRHLQEHYCDHYFIAPQPDFEHPWVGDEQGLALDQDFGALVPPLLSSYLRLGARIHGAPAWDREFRCTDLLTILELKEMNPRYYARFFGRTS